MEKGEALEKLKRQCGAEADIEVHTNGRWAIVRRKHKEENSCECYDLASFKGAHAFPCYDVTLGRCGSCILMRTCCL